MEPQSAPLIRFRLLSVAIEEFAWVNPTGNSDDLDDLDARFAFELDHATRHIGVAPRFTFHQQGKEVVILQPLLRFDIHEEDWPALVAETGEVTLPKGLLQHLAVIATGCARGMLYEKAQRQPGYENLLLPIVPVIDLVTQNLVFPPA